MSDSPRKPKPQETPKNPEHSELSWRSMTSDPPGDDSDSDVEETLLDKTQSKNHSSHSWKYYSK